jgi:signal transduction histidine kinase
VFERFYQADGDASRRRFGGLGLGLYISRAIIDAHAGRIWAAPNLEDGAGSVFGFRIPRVSMPIAPAEVAPTGEPPPFVVRRRDT